MKQLFSSGCFYSNMFNSNINTNYNIYKNNMPNSNNSLSFKGKPTIPYRLDSPYQDDFHATSTQIYIRRYLEMVEQGLDDDAIIKYFAPKTKSLTESELKEYKNFLNNLKDRIKKTDEAFKKIIPMMFPKTYYRGVYSSEENRCTKSVLNAKKGDIIKPDLGYPFATSNKSYAENYARTLDGKSNPKSSIVMEIKTPPGVRLARDIEYSSKIPFKDNIVVFPRGVSYEVLDKQEKDGITYIKLKYIEADGLK